MSASTSCKYRCLRAPATSSICAKKAASSEAAFLLSEHSCRMPRSSTVNLPFSGISRSHASSRPSIAKTDEDSLEVSSLSVFRLAIEAQKQGHGRLDVRLNVRFIRDSSRVEQATQLQIAFEQGEELPRCMHWICDGEEAGLAPPP